MVDFKIFLVLKCFFLGKLDPKIEEDPATRQRKALTFSEYEIDFFKVIINSFKKFIETSIPLKDPPEVFDYIGICSLS